MLVPGTGPLLGKGDALWRAQAILTGDIVCFVDADSEDFGEHFVTGLAGPLLRIPEMQFVKALYRRPFKVGDVQMPSGGGRVTELSARPLLNAFYPELAVFGQPLAGEVAVRRGSSAAPVRHPLRDRDGDADRRLVAGRARGHGAGQPRHAPEPAQPLAELTPMARDRAAVGARCACAATAG